MNSEAINFPNKAQESTWVFSVSPESLHHQINTSNMICNSAKRAKLSKDNFGVGQSSKNEYIVA